MVSGLFALVVAVSYVPDEYYANYNIADEWDDLLTLIIDIEAAQKVGSDPTEQQFADLLDVFETIFEYFPSTPENELVYKQCLLTTEDLANEVTPSKYETFKERCFTPITSVINTIQSRYTVRPSIKATPKQGNAPLNVTLDARDSVDPSEDTIPSNNYFWYYKDTN